MEDPIEALTLTNLRELRLCLHLEIACLGRQWKIRRPAPEDIVEIRNCPLQKISALFWVKLRTRLRQEVQPETMVVDMEKLLTAHPLAPCGLLCCSAFDSRMTIGRQHQ